MDAVATGRQPTRAQLKALEKEEAWRNELSEEARTKLAEQGVVPEEPAKPEAAAPPARKPYEAYVPKGKFAPSGPLTYVQCDVPGYEGLLIGYDLSARWSAIHGPVADQDGMGVYRRIRKLCRHFDGWDYEDDMLEQPVPAPDPEDLSSYFCLGRQFAPLGRWLLNDGYNAALEISLGNSERTSQTASSS